MNTTHFDRLTSAISTFLSRRAIIGALGLGALGLSGLAEAKKRKTKKKKVKRNGFGCVNVGSFCKCSSQCCSGICDGKQGKKTCQAHGAQGCGAGQKQGFCGGVEDACATSTGVEGLCDTTTGNAGY